MNLEKQSQNGNLWVKNGNFLHNMRMMRIDAHVMRIGRCIRMANPSTGPRGGPLNANSNFARSSSVFSGDQIMQAATFSESKQSCQYINLLQG